MITNTMVGHIKDKLNVLTQGKNTNFGVDTGASTAPDEGILVILTENQNLQDLEEKEILASSTVLTDIDTGGNAFTVAGGSDKTINVMNIPYSETISLVDAGTSKKAKGFAIVQVEGTNLKEADIVGSNAEVISRKKYVIDKESLTGCKILFSGSLSSEQTIEVNNSFSLSNIKITFS